MSTGRFTKAPISRMIEEQQAGMPTAENAAVPNQARG
ncbi:hypothetical protein ROA7023_01438 [Roseisalinus antarcticus]|uniref:Uncharacterized protein n=1 Tax=Roseisalinus antarcticus TaxID=254357 RepID=A0A1Y5SCW3_9RHOB|nr:hypothetical protein ROA7023_01438 [Roseisalinus antarcticus]